MTFTSAGSSILIKQSIFITLKYGFYRCSCGTARLWILQLSIAAEYSLCFKGNAIQFQWPEKVFNLEKIVDLLGKSWKGMWLLFNQTITLISNSWVSWLLLSFEVRIRCYTYFDLGFYSLLILYVYSAWWTLKIKRISI